ncbi:hypothetical protein AB0H34_18800 [Saccharopolyspora shandongensis]
MADPDANGIGESARPRAGGRDARRTGVQVTHFAAASPGLPRHHG